MTLLAMLFRENKLDIQTSHFCFFDLHIQALTLFFHFRIMNLLCCNYTYCRSQGAGRHLRKRTEHAIQSVVNTACTNMPIATHYGLSMYTVQRVECAI